MKFQRLILVLVFISAILAFQGCLKTTTRIKGGIRGTVTDSSGKLLGGVRVYVPNAATYSDSNGAWMIENLDPDVYTITASRDNYESQTTTVEIPAGQFLENVNFALVEKGSIYGISASSITSSEAVVTFNTKAWSTSHVEYGQNTQYGSFTPQTATATLWHQVKLSELRPTTTYHFICVTTDNQGRTVRSANNTFTTSFTARSDPPTSLQASKDPYSDSVMLNWSAGTGGDAAGYKLYKSESKTGPFISLDNSLLSQTSYTDTQVYPGKKYFYRVTCVSGTGEESPPGPTTEFLVPGITRCSVVWSSENSPYHLTGNLTVSVNDSLTITPGTRVIIADNSTSGNICIKIQGTIIIQGVSGNPVTFSSAAASPKAGDWEGIVFENNANLQTSFIKGLELSFARNGIMGKTGIPPISDSTIAHCSESAVECNSSPDSVSISNVTADTCRYGFVLASNTNRLVSLDSSTATRCLYGIISKNNGISEVTNNRVKFASIVGIDLENYTDTSKAEKNVVGPGSVETAVILRGKDILRRNTLQGQVGVEISGDASTIIRSNLFLSDNSKSAIGVLYRGDELYSQASQTVQGNVIWDIPLGNARRYCDATGGSLSGIGSDNRVDPALEGGNPFAENPSIEFSFIPAPVSALKGIGYAGEDVGAYDVPR